ncbi:MAG: hypothetical protein AAB600_04225 [Patescibacteria group bacterium]
MSKEVYTGVRGIDVTTAGFIHDPKRAFEITNELNNNQPKDKWMEIEVYPILDKKPLALLNVFTKRVKRLPPTPEGVTVKQIFAWQKELPNTKVIRVHLPFAYDVPDLWCRALGDLKNPRHFLWMYALGAAVNKKGIELAQKLEELQDREVGISAHTNIIKGFSRDGKLEEVKSTVSGSILVESSGRAKSSIIKDMRYFCDPAMVASIAEKFNLDGILFGVDHAITEGVDVEAAIENPIVKRTIQAMHISGPHHDLIGVGDERLINFLRILGEIEFPHDVRVAIDYDPRKIKKQSTSVQLETVRYARDFILNHQNKR